MSTAAVLSATTRSDSPAKPSDSADVPLEDAHEKIMESEEPLPGVTKIKEEPTEINNNMDETKMEDDETGEEKSGPFTEESIKNEKEDEEKVGVLTEESIKNEKADEEKVGVSTVESIKNEVADEERVGVLTEESIKNEDADEERVGVLTEEMIKEEEQLEEEALKKEKKLEEDQEKLWKQMSDEDRDQRYRKLKFLLSKSNMYTQYLIDRMKRQTEEEAKKKERQRKRIKKKVEKEKEKEQNEKEQKAKEQETDNLETASQSSQASTSSTRSTRKRKSEVMSPGETAKTQGKKARKKDGAKDESNSQTEDKENSQGDTNVEESKGDNSEAKDKVEQEEDQTPNTAAEEDAKEEPEIQIPNRIINGEKVPDGQPMMFSGGVLRSYQVEGYSWLKVLFENGVNGILADEMGLGKTVQCVALIAHLASMGVSGPFLVVGPLSTVPNWYNEFRRFTPKVPVVLYHGSQTERQSLRSKIRQKHLVRKNVEVQPVVITSYEIAMNDRKFLAGYEWKYLIVDEGHRLKNTHCRLIRELRMYHTTHRLLLTGTPLQNNLAELWSLLNFLLPEIFDDLGSFESWFHVEKIRDAADDERIVAEEQRDNIISMLHQILTPFMLRRLKSDVDLFIPPKREVLVMAPLTQMQKEYYSSIVDKTILEKIGTRYETPEVVEVNSQGRPVRKTKKKKVNYSMMVEDPKDDEPKKNKKAKYEEDLEAWFKTIVDIQEENGTPSTKKARKSLINVKMQNSMMQLRKCCSHPYLLEHPIEEESGHLVADETIVKHSGKMLMLDKLLPELKKRGHKVLVFCQMTTMMNILESYCHLRDFKYCRLDGSRSVVNRGEQIKSFNEDPDIFVFLVSTRAGGLGINLTGADTVIIYDSDWNPQSDLQAQDRCHRIGQTKPVLVYRFVTANTIDQKIVERAAAKRKLEKLIIHKEKFKTGMKEFSTSLKPISPEELLELLKSRDHEGVVHVNEKNVISNKDLENLLCRDDLYRKMDAMRGGTKSETPKPKRGKAKSKTKEPVLEGKVFKVLDEETACYTNQAQQSKATDVD